MNHDLSYIAQSLGLKKMGGEYKGPCPICGGDDRYWMKRGRKHDFVVGCRHGCSFPSIMRELESRGLVEREPYERTGLTSEQRKQCEIDKVLVSIFEAERNAGKEHTLAEKKRYRLALCRVANIENKSENRY